MCQKNPWGRTHISSGAQTIHHSALKFSGYVENIAEGGPTVHAIRLIINPGAQTSNHSALKFSGYVSNMAEKLKKSIMQFCTKY